MTHPLVVNIRNSAYDVYIGRARKNEPENPWANRFVIGVDGTRKECIEKFRIDGLQRGLDVMARDKLKGAVLGCFCAPKDCHGDVLATWANGLPLK